MRPAYYLMWMAKRNVSHSASSVDRSTADSGNFVVVVESFLSDDQKERLRRIGQMYGRRILFDDSVPYGPIRHALENAELITESESERVPDSLSARLARLDVVPGAVLSSEKAQVLVVKIAGEASDLFDSRSAAARWLETADFDGQTAYQLIANGRIVTVLARLDELRFGTSG